MVLCRSCKGLFVMPLSCGCVDICPECVLARAVRFPLRSRPWTDSIPVCRVLGHSIPIAEVLEIACGSSLEDHIAVEFAVIPTLRLDASILLCQCECDYLGWVPTSLECGDPLLCSCGQQWTDPRLLPWWRRWHRTCRDLLAGTHDLYSLLWKEVWAEPCPDCGIYIEADASYGCCEVTCRQCRLTLCWHCMQTADHHDSAQSFNLERFLNLVLSVFAEILCMKVLWICYQLGFTTGYFYPTLLNLACFWFAVICTLIFALTDKFTEIWQVVAMILGIYCAIIVLDPNHLELGWWVMKAMWTLAIAAAHCSLSLVYLQNR